MINFPVSDWMPDAKIPSGPIQDKWSKYKLESKLINPNNKRKYTVLVVGSGLAGASAAATLAELGYNVKCFCYQDSPRRAHSIAAQGGINAAKNYQNDGDSVYRLFYDTVKGGDFRAREANVYRLAEVSSNIIDQCVAQGVPFGREYGGLLDNRSFGGAQLKRTFYARGQTGQQLLLGAYQALEKEVAKGHIEMFSRHEMMDLVLVDGEAKGIVTRNLVTGEIKSYAGDTVLLCTGGYGNVFFLSTNAMGCNVTANWRAHRKGAYFGNPCYTQIHPTCIPVHGETQSKLTLMSESLRNDGRIWVPKKAEDCTKDPRQIAEEDRDYYLERIYPAFGNLVPRDIASRQAKNMCDEGRGVGPEVKEIGADGVEHRPGEPRRRRASQDQTGADGAQRHDDERHRGRDLRPGGDGQQERQQRGGEQDEPVQEPVPHRARVGDRDGGVARRAVHQVVGGRLAHDDDDGEDADEEVDEQHHHRGQRRPARDAGHGGDEEQQHQRQQLRHLVVDVADDLVVDAAAQPDRGHERPEVVVGQDHLTGLLRHHAA